MKDDTAKVPAPCGWCGSKAEVFGEMVPPEFHELLTDPVAFRDNCVISPRWRWCSRMRFFFAFLGLGAPVPFPATPFPGGSQ